MDHHKNGTEAATVRVGEERAARILERAAALDADRSSEIELDQLREAAAAAGISPEAFDQAMAELDGVGDNHAPSNRTGGASYPRPSGNGSGVSSADFAHFTAVLRDIMGDDGHVSLVENRIEWQDKTGVTVSVSPTGRGTTTAVAIQGKLMTRMLAVGIPMGVCLVLSFMMGIAEDDLFIAFGGFLLSTPVFLGSSWWTYRREQRRLRKKADSVRRQLQRLLVNEAPHDDTASRIARLLPRNDRSA